MKVLDSLPDGCDTPKPRVSGLRPNQLLVLRVLLAAKGPLNRTKITTRANISGTYMNRALGLDDPEKRPAFENCKEVGYPSLLTLGFIDRHELDINGTIEIAYTLSDKGLELAKSLKLSPLRGLPPQPTK